MPSRIWLIAAALWFAGAVAWLTWLDYAMVQNMLGIACGYPDAAAKAFAACMAMDQPRASAAMWSRAFSHTAPWALLPALAIVLLGGLVARWQTGRR